MKDIKLNKLANDAINKRDMNYLKGGEEMEVGHSCGTCVLSKDTKQNKHNKKPTSNCGLCAYDEPISFE